MENQTRFDLNAAVENWRHELAAQPPLAPDNRRELETHRRDSFAELKARGLSDEESFWLARRRVGPPQKLAEEFFKTDPAKVWRERVFWICLAIFLLEIWGNFSEFVLIWSLSLKWLQMVLFSLSRLIPFTVVFLIGLGKAGKLIRVLPRLIDGRFRLASAIIIMILSAWLLDSWGQNIMYFNLETVKPGDWNPYLQRVQSFQNLFFFSEDCWIFVLAAALIWLLPSQKQKITKQA